MYKDNIKTAMENLANNDKTLFVGYGLKYGSKGAGFLKNIKESQLIETPVAENLMLSMGIGLSLNGYIPVVIFERFDFIMNAMDALVNHLDKLEKISRGEFNPKVIIRCIVGGKNKPFFTGITHTQDFSEALRAMIDIPVIQLKNKESILGVYDNAMKSNKSSIIVEYKDLYENF